MATDLEQLKELYELMLEKDLDTIEIKDADTHIKLTRRSAQPAPAIYHSIPQVSVPAARPASSAAAPTGAGPKAGVPSIESPLAGVFYRASSPTTPPFAKEGDVVDAGQTLCIVEAMKVMNEIKAEKHCKIVRILAENGRSVTAGQALFQIEPA